MLRNLINQAIRARAGTTGARGGYGRGYGGTSRGYGGASRGYGRGRGTSDPGAMIGAEIGRRVFAALRRRG
ncbi:MAG: hypothetical protein M3P93_14395 [Actinomycetota bacterium]|nr:hypothetical protein [Actinomycetota bacterium]